VLNYLLAFLSSFFFVGLKSTQQLNVQHKQYVWILPTSLLMATCEVYVVASVAKNGWGWLVVAIGLGAGLGAIAATWLHDKFIGGKK
jgi:hypothetical protein